MSLSEGYGLLCHFNTRLRTVNKKPLFSDFSEEGSLHVRRFWRVKISCASNPSLSPKKVKLVPRVLSLALSCRFSRANVSINCVAGVGPLLDLDNLTMKYSHPQKPFISSSRGLEALRIQFPSANEKIRIFRCVQSHWFVTN